MTTTVDLAALAAAGQSRVTLLGGTITSLGSTGTDYAGFDDASAVYVEVQVQLRDSRRGAPSLTLLLQGSDDGNSWSTLETFTFTNNGTQTATVDTPNAHLRVSWTVASNTEWYIDHVTVAPASLNAPGGGGGGSQTITRAQYDLALTGLEQNTLTKMPFAFNYGTELLDLTDPTNPTPVESATYSFAVSIGISGITAGAGWSVVVTLDEDDFSGTMSAFSNIPGTSGAQAVTFPFYVPAGSPCHVKVSHDANDLGGANLSGHVYVQRW